MSTATPAGAPSTPPPAPSPPPPATPLPPPPPPPGAGGVVPPDKEALLATTDFLKFTIALGAGALVFGAGLVGDKIPLPRPAQWLVIISWVLLGLSVGTGVLAYGRIPIKLADSDYDLKDSLFQWMGRFHQGFFVFGMMLLGLALAIGLFAKAGAAAQSDADKDKKKGQAAAVKALGPPLLLGRVGPFASGKVVELEAAPAGEPWLRVDDVTAELRARTRDAELGYLILVGSADKIELLPALRQQYGSNASLARLRAETVRRAVEVAVGRAVSTVTLATGPEVQGVGLASTTTRADRSVAVYAAWWAKTEPVAQR
jgi:U5 snRNP spliceosome subunit